MISRCFFGVLSKFSLVPLPFLTTQVLFTHIITLRSRYLPFVGDWVYCTPPLLFSSVTRATNSTCSTFFFFSFVLFCLPRQLRSRSDLSFSLLSRWMCCVLIFERRGVRSRREDVGSIG
jgi:hypothetical protein